jgi:hypothetical protein
LNISWRNEADPQRIQSKVALAERVGDSAPVLLVERRFRAGVVVVVRLHESEQHLCARFEDGPSTALTGGAPFAAW